MAGKAPWTFPVRSHTVGFRMQPMTLAIPQICPPREGAFGKRRIHVVVAVWPLVWLWKPPHLLAASWLWLRQLSARLPVLDCGCPMYRRPRTFATVVVSAELLGASTRQSSCFQGCSKRAAHSCLTVCLWLHVDTNLGPVRTIPVHFPAKP